MASILLSRTTFFESVVRALGEDRDDMRLWNNKVLILESDTVFESGRAKLQRQGRSILNVVANAAAHVGNDIGEQGDWLLQTDIHAGTGPISSAYRTKLDLSRAQVESVRVFFQEAAFPTPRLLLNAYGEEAPLDPRDTDVAHRRNRRMEFRLCDPNTPPTEPEVSRLVKEALDT